MESDVSPAALGSATVAVAGLAGASRRLFTALGDIGRIIAIVYAFPVAIIAIGAPIALLVRLVMRIVRAL